MNLIWIHLGEIRGTDPYPFIIEEYNCVYENRKTNGGGTALLIKKQIPFTKLKLNISIQEL